MIRSIVLGALLTAAAIGAIYLMGAFYSVDMNFVHWTADTRAACVAGFAFVMLIAIPVAIISAISLGYPVPRLPPPPPPR